MMCRVVLVIAVSLGACNDNYLGGVRDSDRVAWQRVPIIEVERHPLFSTLPRDEKKLSDGSELWDFANCAAGKAPTNCKTGENPVSGGLATTCTGGANYTTCCHNQFLVRAGFVEEYRPIGNCVTDCTTRPGGTCR